MSGVRCQLIGVKCHMSGVACHVFFSHKVVKLVGGGSVINGAYPVYFYYAMTFQSLLGILCIDFGNNLPAFLFSWQGNTQLDTIGPLCTLTKNGIVNVSLALALAREMNFLRPTFETTGN